MKRLKSFTQWADFDYKFKPDKNKFSFDLGKNQLKIIMPITIAGYIAASRDALEVVEVAVRTLITGGYIAWGREKFQNFVFKRAYNNKSAKYDELKIFAKNKPVWKAPLKSPFWDRMAKFFFKNLYEPSVELKSLGDLNYEAIAQAAGKTIPKDNITQQQLFRIKQQLNGLIEKDKDLEAKALKLFEPRYREKAGLFVKPYIGGIIAICVFTGLFNRFWTNYRFKDQERKAQKAKQAQPTVQPTITQAMTPAKPVTPHPFYAYGTIAPTPNFTMQTQYQPVRLQYQSWPQQPNNPWQPVNYQYNYQ